MTDFEAGVIGAGAAFRRLYAPSFQRGKGIRFAAVADPAFPSLPDVKVYASAEEMLNGETLDGVVVLSPPALHAAHVALCSDRGLKVLVEKPPAATVAEVDGWTNAELITPAFSRRYDSRYARRALPGRQWHFTLQTNPAGWGALTAEPVERDLLPHAADLARWLTGEEIMSTSSVHRSAGGATGSFLLHEGGCFDWEVRHGGSHIERLVLDGEELATETPGVLHRARLRLLREPGADVVAIGKLLQHWIGSPGAAEGRALATVADARACAAVIEAVERSPIGVG